MKRKNDLIGRFEQGVRAANDWSCTESGIFRSEESLLSMQAQIIRKHLMQVPEFVKFTESLGIDMNVDDDIPVESITELKGDA